MQAQTRPYAELIVGDDASEDETREVVVSFRDPRIRYVRHERNVGIYRNWNSLISLCSGDCVCIYHDHDQYLRTILERSANLLDEHPDMPFVHTALTFADAAGTLVGLDIRPFPAVMTGAQMRQVIAEGLHSPIMAATAMVRRTAYHNVGFYEPDKYGLGCDKHMWFRLAQLGPVGYVSAPQATIRVRERNAPTAKFDWDNVFGSFQMQQEETGELYVNNPLGRASAERRMARERDRLLLLFSLRALLLERPEAWSAVEERVLALMGAGARLVYRATRAFRPLQHLIRATALPLHYSRIARVARNERRRAEAYALQHSEAR